MCTGLEPLLFGSAAVGQTAATAGLIGSAGSFSLGTTLGSLGALGGLASAAGSIAQAGSQGDITEYNAKIAQNQEIAARQKAEFDEQRQRQQARLFAGKQRNVISESGGELLDAGDVLGMTAEEAEIDALAIRYGGNIAAQSARQSGALAKATGKQAQTASYAKAGQTLLTSGAKIGERFV
jgi:hypothetical protein